MLGDADAVGEVAADAVDVADAPEDVIANDDAATADVSAAVNEDVGAELAESVDGLGSWGDEAAERTSDDDDLKGFGWYWAVDHEFGRTSLDEAMIRR